MADKKEKAKREVKKMSEDEIKDFNALCDYIKYKVLEYDESMKFPKFLALRIKGIQEGTFIPRGNRKIQANYTYSDILLTFRVHRFGILGELRDKSKFTDEKHRINYMMKIIESKLNDVVEMRKSKDKANAKAENIKVESIELGEYKKKTKITKNNRLKDLW